MTDFVKNTKYRFFFINDGVKTQFYPTGTISVSWELEDGTFFYKSSIGGFTVNGDDYKYLKAIETAGDICKTIFINIERRCNKEWNEYVTGEFTIQNCQFNNSKCNITVSPEATGGGKCLLDNAGNELDMFKEILLPFPGVDGFAEITDAIGGPDVLLYDNGHMFFYTASALEPILVRPQFLDGSGLPATSGTSTLTPTIDEVMNAGVIGEDERDHIAITRMGVVQTGGNPPYVIYVAWAYRRSSAKISGVCQATPKGYTLVNDSGPTCVFQKKPTDNDMSINPTGVFGDCAVVGAAPVDSSVIWNGAEITAAYPSGFCAWLEYKDQTYSYLTLSLEGALQVFLDKCGITQTISDFFQINPENVSSINYVTGADTHTDDIRFVQKSNAIFPILANSLTGIMSWTDLTSILEEAFQAFWTIDINGDLRYEHVSFYENVIIGLDLNTPEFSKYVNGKINYSYKRELLPFIEKVSDDGNHINPNWNLQSIKYIDTNDNKLNCVGTTTLERSWGIFTSDVDYYLEYPTEIPRDGWLIVACTTGGGNPYIIPFDGFPNGHMSIKRLVVNYYKHSRSALLGQINGVNVTFETTVRLKEEDGLSVPICCADDFDPRKNVSTPNGIGRVISAEHNLKSEKLTLKTEY